MIRSPLRMRSLRTAIREIPNYGPVPVKFVAAPAGMLLLRFVICLVCGLNVNPFFEGLIV